MSSMANCLWYLATKPEVFEREHHWDPVLRRLRALQMVHPDKPELTDKGRAAIEKTPEYQQWKRRWQTEQPRQYAEGDELYKT